MGGKRPNDVIRFKLIITYKKGASGTKKTTPLSIAYGKHPHRALSLRKRNFEMISTV